MLIGPNGLRPPPVYIMGMRAPALSQALAAVLCAGCGGDFPIIGGPGPGSVGLPADVVQVRLFDAGGADRTLHTGLLDNEMVQMEARLFAADGRRLTEITGGVDFALRFVPDTLATSTPIPGEPLQRLITPTAVSGSVGSQSVELHFPGDNSTKTFGPFHVQVEPSVHNGVAEMRLFDSRGADMTGHIPLVIGDTLRLEVRLYDTEGRQLTNVAAEIGFRVEPDSVAASRPVAGMPFFKDLYSTATTALAEASLFVSVLFLADSVTKTYRPVEILLH